MIYAGAACLGIMGQNISVKKLAGAASAVPAADYNSILDSIYRVEYSYREAPSREHVQEAFDAIREDSLINEFYKRFPPMLHEPLIYSGYRTMRRARLAPEPPKFRMDARRNAYDRDRYAGILYSEDLSTQELEEGDDLLIIGQDSVAYRNGEGKFAAETIEGVLQDAVDESISENPLEKMVDIPEWLEIGLRAQRLHDDMRYYYMVNNPAAIDYAYWDLPVPPSLPQEDRSFGAYIKSLKLPEVDASSAVIPEFEQRRINWLHTVGGGVQFSQAYISSNWYQGGNNYLALLFNFNWDVELNTVYHPNMLFQSNLGYKLALNSNPGESLHKYSISQDLFQYNLKMGLKAFNHWFYSFNMQLKTQLFNSYPADSPDLTAQFLSPGDLNVGIGMLYDFSKFDGRLKFTASISPLSYNLKTCLSNRIDHAQFNIAADRRTTSEIGSNAELNLNWQISSNISWKSRLFLFTDYHYFLADWENTLNFTINKFLSTQLYLHPRFDSSSDFNASGWHYWSLKEILSFGLSYTFSTKS